MKPEAFEKWVEGRTCNTCAIFKPDTFCFFLGWSDLSDIEDKKENCFYLVHRLSETNSDGKPQDIGLKFNGSSRCWLATNPTAPELVMAMVDGNILHHVNGSVNWEEMLTREDVTSTQKVKYIGRSFYVAGHVRSVLRRDGVEQWTNLTREIQDDSLTTREKFDLGFDDIDGFDEADIYAVGGFGDVWHYNGKRWASVDIPTNGYICSVCCASDGNVYIGGAMHLVLRGRGDKWEIVNREETNDRFEQIVDYQGRILAVNEWGNTIFEITPDGVIEMDTGGFHLPPTSCLCLAVGHGMLLTAGSETASLFDGKTWHRLFRSRGADDAVLVQSMLNDTNQAIETLTKDLENIFGK